MVQTQRVALALAAISAATAGCNDRSRASHDVKWNDRPADITCWTYGTQSFDGRSTGRVGYDEGGRISFVDAANGRYTTVEGDCRVVYLTEGAGDARGAAPAHGPLSRNPLFSPSASGARARRPRRTCCRRRWGLGRMSRRNRR